MILALEAQLIILVSAWKQHVHDDVVDICAKLQSRHDRYVSCILSTCVTLTFLGSDMGLQDVKHLLDVVDIHAKLF
jgi:hypothetical protein